MSEHDVLRWWIATDQSDAAQCVREAVAPSVTELTRMIRAAQELAPTPDHWVLVMRDNTYSLLLPPMRKKMHRYARSLYRKASHDRHARS